MGKENEQCMPKTQPDLQVSGFAFIFAYKSAGETQ
jgi:hypothetical protein